MSTSLGIWQKVLQWSREVLEIYAVGTDIIEVERITAAIEKNNSFRERIYTLQEIEYCEKKSRGKYSAYAARFAAKEAVAKSLLEGFGKKISPSEIEVQTNKNGAPWIMLHGRTERYSRELGIGEIKISMSATENYAVAYAVSLK
jgi:holo-[acyl-carrier protein] synthase